uniref:Transcription initiation factor TFIID subunit 12 domain-containing protein n=1 Tax=Oryza punctata TaxID=4537 RepID=A0A0E0JQZ7_ORYPU
MADPPSAAATASPQPDQLAAAAVSTPQNPNPNPLLSPQIPPVAHRLRPLRHLLDPSSAGGGAMEYPPRPPQMQASSPGQAAAGAGGFGQIHRSGSGSRLAAVSQLPQYAAAAARMYGNQVNFSGGGGQVGQQQQQQLAARAAMLSQGQLGMLQGQGNAASAAHYGLQSQMMAQPRQKGMVQGAQFNTANAAQALQGMQSMGVMGGMRANGTIPYNQQRFAHAQAQLRPQQTSQQGTLSPQKVVGQGLTRTASIAALNSQLPGSSTNGPMAQMSLPQKQQQAAWLKQMQSSLGSPVSPQQFQHQQRMLLIHQLQQQSGLNQHQIAQSQQQHPHLNTQLLQQQHILQQLQQQQQSPRISASGSQKSMNLTGSQPGTPLSGGTMTGGSASQGAEGTNQLLGKRKIQDLVAQVDPLGKVDPEVEDLLLEIADDFIDSVTAFACTLAKHRKSSVLEAKDVLLHLEKNWHLSVPGFLREDKNPQRHPVKVSADPQQPECDAAGIRSTGNKLLPTIKQDLQLLSLHQCPQWGLYQKCPVSKHHASSSVEGKREITFWH